MTDDTFQAYEAKLRRVAELNREILPRNRQILFDALAAAGIALVTISFDGSGDSGQFEDLTGFDAANDEVDVPNASITVGVVDLETVSITDETTTIRQFMDALACDLLEEKHDGWENEGGAFGEFRFTVADRTIKLDYNERYEASDHYEYDL